MRMKNETYDILKWVAIVVLPAVVTFVAALGQIWGLPYYAQIAATIAAIDTLLGACLQVSTANYTPVAYDEDTDDVRDDIELKETEVGDIDG